MDRRDDPPLDAMVDREADNQDPMHLIPALM